MKSEWGENFFLEQQEEKLITLRLVVVFVIIGLPYRQTDTTVI